MASWLALVCASQGLDPDSESDPCAGRYVAKAIKDPHWDLANGGRADFRGKHNSLYNYLSAPGLSINVRLEEALYTLRDGQLLVNGTFMTEAHVGTIVAGKTQCKWAYVSYIASELNQQNWGWGNVRGSCGGHNFRLGPNAEKNCSGVRTSTKMSTATIAINPFGTNTDSAPWELVIHGDHVHDRVAGPLHRLDLELSYSPRKKAPLIAHGLIGQSFLLSSPRVGRLDVYPEAGTFTTSAQAEGAIEGTGEMYEVPSPFETDGAFSRFGGAEAGGSGTAAAAVATCDAKLAQEIVDVAAASADRRLKRMALGVIQQGIDGLKLYLRQEAKAARMVARATSLEVQSGEDLTAAHRRLAEEPACAPPLSPPPPSPPPPLLPGESLATGTEFILRIPDVGRRRRRALSAFKPALVGGLSTVRSAVIEAMNGVGVSITAAQVQVESFCPLAPPSHVCDVFKVTITRDVVASADAFLEKLRERFYTAAEFEVQPKTISIIVFVPNCKSFCPSKTWAWSDKCTWNGCSGCAQCAAATPPPPSASPSPPPPSASPSPPPPACDNYPETSSPSYVDTYYTGADTPFDSWGDTPPGTTVEDRLQACKEKCDTDSWSDPDRFTGRCVGIGYAGNVALCHGVMDPPYHQDAAMQAFVNWNLLMKDNC